MVLYSVFWVMQTVISSFSCHFRVVQRCFLWPIPFLQYCMPAVFMDDFNACLWSTDRVEVVFCNPVGILACPIFVEFFSMAVLSWWFHVFIYCVWILIIYVYSSSLYSTKIWQASIQWAVHLSIVLHRPTQIVVDVVVTSPPPTEITRMLVVINARDLHTGKLYMYMTYEFSFRSLCLCFGSNGNVYAPGHPNTCWGHSLDPPKRIVKKDLLREGIWDV